VALLHFAGLQVEEFIRADRDWQVYGWMGVDMFFIISGFIMVWVTAAVAGGTRAAGQFLAHRAIRKYPLWFACAALVGMFFYLVDGVPASIYAVSKEEAWPFFIRSFFLIPQEMKPVIDVGWTLIHELFFYLIFALILALGLRSKLAIGIAVWGVVTAAGLHLGLGKHSPVLDVIFNPLSFLFMGGMVTAHLILCQDKPAFAFPAV